MVAVFDEFGQHLLGVEHPVTIEFLRPGRIRVRSGPRDIDIMMTREEMQRIVDQFRSEVGNAAIQDTHRNH